MGQRGAFFVADQGAGAALYAAAHDFWLSGTGVLVQRFLSHDAVDLSFLAWLFFKLRISQIHRPPRMGYGAPARFFQTGALEPSGVYAASAAVLCGGHGFGKIFALKALEKQKMPYIINDKTKNHIIKKETLDKQWLLGYNKQVARRKRKAIFKDKRL